MRLNGYPTPGRGRDHKFMLDAPIGGGEPSTAAREGEGLELLSRRVTNDPEVLRAIFAELRGEGEVALGAAYGFNSSGWANRVHEAPRGRPPHASSPRFARE